MSEGAVVGSVRPAVVEHRDLEVDGVRVLYFPDDSGQTSATLVFGAGQRDETLPTRCTLHALEHAVMGTVRRTPIEVNGCVAVSTTQFTAEGSPHRVSAFLTGVCHGLADPPVTRLVHEARVLEAEGDAGGGVNSPATVARFGYRDVGIVDGPGAGPGAVRAESVRAAAARWFVAENALLVLEGAWLDDLHLPLPRGSRPERTQVPVRHVTRPSAITVEAPVCELNLVVPAEAESLTRLAVTVLDDRLTEVLRHEHGLAYTLDIDLAPIPAGYELTVTTDPTPGRVRECFRVMVETVRTLFSDGPTEAELEHARAVVLESSTGREAGIGLVVDPAIEELIGVGPRLIDPDAVVQYDGRQVTDYFRRIAQDLIYVVDEDAEPDLARLGLEPMEPDRAAAGPLPTGETFRPPLLALALSKQARTSRLVLTSSGLAHAYDGLALRLDWPEVVGVMRDEDGDMVVFGAEGQAIPLGPGLYKKGQRLVDAVLANVPADLIYDAPPDPEEADSD